jgi:hypothetical protein
MKNSVHACGSEIRRTVIAYAMGVKFVAVLFSRMGQSREIRIFFCENESAFTRAIDRCQDILQHETGTDAALKSGGFLNF